MNTDININIVLVRTGIAVGAGEIQEELSAELADKEEQLESARARIAELEAENAKLRGANGNSNGNTNANEEADGQGP